MADAVWLTWVLLDAHQQYTTPVRIPQDREQPFGEQSSGSAQAPTADISADEPEIVADESVDHDEPAGQRNARFVEPESSVQNVQGDRLAGRDKSDDQPDGEMSSSPATDLGGTRPLALVPLSGSVDILRALRPLKRKVSSLREDEVVLDEEATVEWVVQNRLWWPVTMPEMVRLLDLTLVVDVSPSMSLWQSTVSAFISLVQQLGAFRTIQIRMLDTDRPRQESPATPVLLGGGSVTAVRSPAELLDPSGRRMLLVLTDGIGQCWRQDMMSPLLALWGESMPVAVVNVLSQRLWQRHGLAVHRARLTVPGPLKPNRRWGLELPDAWLEPDPTAVLPAGVVPVPVLELKARWLGWWARLITGSYRASVDAVVLLARRNQTMSPPATETTEREPDNKTTDSEQSARQQVEDFLSLASPKATRLATLLAAVPISVPIARFVQAELVPESDRDHLAEVFTSGLLCPRGTLADGCVWDDTVTFDLPDIVRGVLLSRARRTETTHVVRLVTERFGDQMSTLRHFRDALEQPDSTPDPRLTAATAPQVMIQHVAMRALSGPYLSRADRLLSGERHQSTERENPSHEGLPTGAEVINGARMSDVTKSTDHLVSESLPSLVSDPVSPEVPAESPGEAEPGDTPTATQPGQLMPTFVPMAGHERRRPGDPPPIWGNVPPRNLNFTGRGELLDLLGDRLTAGGATAVLPAALHGMGGIGKTQMAVEYVYRQLEKYDVIWWIQAAQQAQVRAGLTELAQRLQLPGSAEANTAVPAVREALRLGQPFRKWLLVFDSAEDPGMVRSFFPANGPGEILITSRNPDWAGIARPLEVAVFKREESKELLGRRGQEIDGVDADRLAEALGDLPLAIEQAAAWLAETGMPVREYLRLFDEKMVELLDTSAPTDYPASVAAAWNVSFDELSTRNPAAHQLLQVCAFFSPEPISRSLFTGVRGVSISRELDAALRDPIKISRAIRDINRYSLAKIDHRNDTLQLHRLVQLALRARMTPQRQAEMGHGAHLLLTNLDPNDPASSKNWPRYQEVLPHAYAAKVMECDDPWVRQLILNLMVFLYQWGDHDEACRLAQQAVDVWTEKLGDTDPQTLRAASNLGFYLWTLGRYSQAAEVNQHTVELHRRVSGKASEEALTAELAVAIDLKGQGDFIGALALNRQIYQEAKSLFGEDDPTTLTTAHDLVVSLGLAGEYRKGQELAQDTHRRRADVLGYDNPGTNSTLNALILDRREAGDYTWARIEQEKLAERSRKIFGDDKVDTLRRLHHLSVARRKDGHHEAALELSRRVLKRFLLRYGDKHPNAMACALAHSIDLRHDDKLEDSRDLGEKTFELYRKSLGEHHPHTLSAVLDLAVTLRRLGDSAGAQQLDERALEQFRTILGADHPYAIVSAINLASDRAALGEAESALELGTEALERAQRVLGADHPTTLAATMNLVLDLRTLGRTQEAETKYAEVVTRYRRVLSDKHPATRDAGAGVRADCDIDPLPL